MNGKNVLTFDGSSDFLDLGTGLDFIAGSSHSSFIVIADGTSYSNIYGAATGRQGASSLHVGFSNSSSYRMNYWSHDYGTGITSNFVPSGSILNYIWDVGSPKQIRANGKVEGTSSGNALAIGTMAGGGRISNVTGHGYLGADIAEIIFLTGTVSPVERERMEGYLAHKWGLSDNLATDLPYKDAFPEDVSAQLTLTATATDPNGDSLVTAWSQVSGPGPVIFGNPSAPETTATFVQAGTYVLRLTANDGNNQTFDELTITVTEPSSYSTWISGFEVGGMTALTDDYDGDGITNAVENYFGTDPGSYNQGLSATQVVRRASTTFEFKHPISDSPATDLTAAYLWSTDLTTFHPDGHTDANGTTVTFTQGSPVDGEVTLTAGIEGTQPDKLFIAVDVILQ